MVAHHKLPKWSISHIISNKLKYWLPIIIFGQLYYRQILCFCTIDLTSVGQKDIPISVAKKKKKRKSQIFESGATIIFTLQMTGARIRSQAPLINHVNADAVTWTTMWRAQVRMGVIPYYMFVERDTGAKHYFEVKIRDILVW